MSTVKPKGKFHVKLSAYISKFRRRVVLFGIACANPGAKLKRGEVFDVSRETQKF